MQVWDARTQARAHTDRTNTRREGFEQIKNYAGNLDRNFIFGLLHPIFVHPTQRYFTDKDEALNR